MRWFLATILLLLGIACRSEDGDSPVRSHALPQHGLTPQWGALEELGWRLFQDQRLSLDATMSCASCHHPQHFFTDALNVPVGVTGAVLPRNSQSLMYVGFQKSLTWANPVVQDLAAHALIPLFSETPPEMHLGPVLGEVLQLLANDSELDQLTARAFPKTAQSLGLFEIQTALAALQSALHCFDSNYDRYVAGEQTALSSDAIRGMELFFGQATCHSCHSGPLLNGQSFAEDTGWGRNHFTGNRLLSLGEAAKPLSGMAEFTGRSEDWDIFRVPSLRNIGKTAPYFHDGRIASLSEVVGLYDKVHALELSESKQSQLVTFLENLEDQCLDHPLAAFIIL